MAVLSTLNGDVQSLMDAYLWEAINLDAPTWWLHPIFMTLWSDKGAFEQICEAAPQLTFAPGLAEVLDSPTPPTLEYFRSLPEAGSKDWWKHWAIYLHIYELEGRKPRIYIGSSTSEVGAATRLAEYEDTTSDDGLPIFVKRAIAQGFQKTRTTLLAWSDIPAVGIFPRARQRYLGLEGIFQMLFFTSIINNYEPEWVDFMPWCREDVEWEPLCSHISLSERGKGDFDLSFEELEYLNTVRLELRRRNQRKRNHTYHFRHQALNSRRQYQSYRVNKASRKYYCAPCKMAFGRPNELDKHLRNGLHKKNLDKIANGECPERAHRNRLSSINDARHLALRTYHCHLCDKTYTRGNNLIKHYDTKMHRNAAAIADAELIEPPDDDDSDADRDELDNEDLDTDLDGFQVSDGD
ncbi:hypothetical protein HBI60_035830 [Parastagonospora nodorum]|nr:hypothetical protein HBI60_035830 [Parastagonospora nodorum]